MDVEFVRGGKIVDCSWRAGKPATLLTGDHCGRNDHRFRAFNASPLIDGTEETVTVSTIWTQWKICCLFPRKA